MKAYKCDRCGKLFESSKVDPKIIVRLDGSVEVEKIEPSEYGIGVWSTRGWERLDFCPDCQEKFRVFMFGKEDTKPTNLKEIKIPDQSYQPELKEIKIC